MSASPAVPATPATELPSSAQRDWLSAYPPPRSLALDQEALQIYEWAYQIGLKTELVNGRQDPPISFSTVVAALLLGADETSAWFIRQASEYGPKRANVLAEKKIDDTLIKGLNQTVGRPSTVVLSSGDNQLLTSSAQGVLRNAEGWAQRVNGSDIGVRHLVAAYVLNPPPHHRKQMDEWGYKEVPWRTAFFEWVAPRFTWEQWSDASRRPAPTVSLPAFDRIQPKGSSVAWRGDAGANKILARAARAHARRRDSRLQLQTIFYALVETARDDDAVRDSVRPIWQAIAAVGDPYKQSRDAYFAQPEKPGPPSPFDELAISPPVLNTLETARELAAVSLVQRRAAADATVVGALQLAGAMLSRRVDGDQEIAALGLNPQQIREAFVEYARELGEGEETWRELLGATATVFVGRAVDLNSDDAEVAARPDRTWASDPLAIRPDVEAFASLLAARSLKPPLSIGLFGPWGSGKTTFLERLRQAVDARAKAAGDPAASAKGDFVSNVVHVKFNAWHFAESALVSSLVAEIFRAISAYFVGAPAVGQDLVEEKRRALEGTQRQVEAAKALRERVEKEVTDATTRLADANKKASTRATGLRATVAKAWDLARDELAKSRVVQEIGMIDALGGTVTSLNDLNSHLAALRARPARMLRDLGWARTAVFAVLFFALPPLVAWAVGSFLQRDVVAQWFSSLTAMASVIGVWASTASSAVSKVDAAIAEIAATYYSRVTTDQEVIQAQRDLDEANADARTASAQLEGAQQALAAAEADLANASLPAQMLNIVSTRLQDRAYEKELTTMSLARADLQSLSQVLTDQAAAVSLSGKRVDRVILYVDDLDRCKPDDVVRVLQIVHMLLAFELFVVVVAVDARWVEQSLLAKYPWLSGRRQAGSGGSLQDEASWDGEMEGVTAQDYLEKIFQIAFWLEPMTATRAASYLASLVRTPSDDPPDTAPAGATPHIDISVVELDYMRALAAYVGPSPRRVKRLVNAYCLIKARLSEAQLGSFTDDRSNDAGNLSAGPYQIVIGLLVIGTGAPASATAILGTLAECDPRDSFDRVVKQLQRHSEPDWQMAVQVIQTLMRTQKARDASELRGWARKVGRFLLQSPSNELRLNRSYIHAQSAVAVPRASPPVTPQNGSTVIEAAIHDPTPSTNVELERS